MARVNLFARVAKGVSSNTGKLRLSVPPESNRSAIKSRSKKGAPLKAFRHTAGADARPPGAELLEEPL